MMRTITITIGVFFALIFAGFLIRSVFSTINDTDKTEFKDIQARIDGNDLVIAWETDTETLGTVHLNNSGILSSHETMDYRNIHRMIIENVTIPISFFIDSCNILGACSQSQVLSIDN